MAECQECHELELRIDALVEELLHAGLVAGEEFESCGVGLCNCGGSLKPGGKPETAEPGVWEPAEGGPRVGCAGGFWREMRKAASRIEGQPGISADLWRMI